MLRPRTIAAHPRRPRRRDPRASSRPAGCSAPCARTPRRPGSTEPLVCYQGAAVVDPVTRRVAPARADPARARARGDRGRRRPSGFALNCYVDDELYVAAITEHARSYADFQQHPVHEVGDLRGWLERPPTKLVVVDDPDRLDALRPRLEEQFGGRLFIAKSLPYFLELASPAISKGSGLRSWPSTLGFTAAADGRVRRRRERPRAARLGRLRRRGRERERRDCRPVADWVCPSAEEEGVAQVIEALLDSTRMIDLKAARERSGRLPRRARAEGRRRRLRRAARGGRALARARAADRRAARARRS